jgi:hypothetical protein
MALAVTGLAQASARAAVPNGDVAFWSLERALWQPQM